MTEFWILKQPIENLKRLARYWLIDAFADEWAESGAMVTMDTLSVTVLYITNN
jgi:hypothetical protein